MKSDAALADAAASGDRDAFDVLYRRYQPVLFGFVRRQVGDHHLAEDIVQESFLVAWRDLARLRDRSAVKTWLFAIAYRRAMSHAEGRPQVVPLVDAAEPADEDPLVLPETAAERREAQALVWSAALGLEPRQRVVLELSVKWELSSGEISDVLGVKRAHAAVLVHRARSALRNSIKAMLVARQQGRCRGLERLLGPRHRELNARERRSVDHHIRRCPDCRRFGAHVASYASLAVLFGKSKAAKTVHIGGTLLKVGGVGLAASIAVGAYLYPVNLPQVPEQPPAILAETVDPPPDPSSSQGPSPSPSAAPSEQPSEKPSEKPLEKAKLTHEQQMVAIINQRRAEAGCGAVRSDDRLAKAAAAHSADMAAKNYFSHTSQDGRSPWDRARSAGYQYPSAENIAAGNSTAEATMKQLMNSPGHKANILNCSHKAVGVGRATGGTYRYYWTQLFGSR